MSQPLLFDTEPAPWEQDNQSDQLVAAVVFPTGPETAYSYRVPDRLRGEIACGQRVRVPFGASNRPVVGYLVKLENRPAGTRRLKEVAGVVDHQSLLSPAMLRLTEWMADHYLCPWGQVLEAVLPAGVRGQAGTRQVTMLSVPTEVIDQRDSLKLSPKQEKILDHLIAAPRPLLATEVAAAIGCTQAPILTLRRKGLVAAEARRVSSVDLEQPVVHREEHLDLNPDQQQALDALLEPLRAGRHETILVHGVTGSGKTEVYMQAIQEVVSYGRQAIVLVPEISLTPQTRARFLSRFDNVAVLHSHLSDAERHWHWERIARGEVQVVVGARSAVFAPTPQLGLIVLDEEHESSFKQETAPRYHARDVALERARAEGVPLVLGSATPSLESWQRAKQGEYRLVDMPRRIFDRPMPAVGTIDLRNETNRRFSRGAISRQLHRAMHEALEAAGQVILLLNRRGFSTHIQCPACGEVVRCPNCDLALTHHRREDLAICHYCDFRMSTPLECPKCQFTGIRYSGFGTQRLEDEVRSRFPGVACLRMDADSMQSAGSHERALTAFRSGDVKILLGTQMIAKGLDFPNVTLVGVINADTALHLPDFRAAERTFQLVTQVAGRTGRGEKGGRVLVQTYCPDHPAIEAAVRHDFDRFAQYELPIREAHGYPPLAHMTRLVVRGPIESAAREFAAYLGARLRAALAEHPAARVLGPAPAPFPKLRGQFRFHLQMHGPDADTLRAAVQQATADLKLPDDVLWIVDVDPLDML